MPMAEDVDYRAFSVFINITDYSGWLQDRMEWEIHPTIRPYHVLNPWTWLPEVICHLYMLALLSWKGFCADYKTAPLCNQDSLLRRTTLYGDALDL